jgi:hypothetical protein
MTPKAFKLITGTRFPRLDSKTVQACEYVILHGWTAYAAENAQNCKRGTVSRYVNRIHAEYAVCLEVVALSKPVGPPNTKLDGSPLCRD